MKKNLPVIFVMIITLLMLGYALYVIIDANYLRKQLLQHGHYTIATVTSIEHGRKSNNTWPMYTYWVNGKQYKSSGNGIIQKNTGFYFDQWAINRKFYLMYLPANPSKNSILPYCTASPEFSKQNKSWSSLPEGKLKYVIGKSSD